MPGIDRASVMVTGGAGFVGSSVVRELLKRQARVVCFDNFLHGVPENVVGLGPQVTVVRGDVLDPIAIVATLRQHQVEYVINCVGDTYVPSAYWAPRRFFDINLLGNMNVLQASKIAGVRRLLYVSSTEVYGNVKGVALNEQAPLSPVNTYAVSKMAADRLCFTFCVEHKMPVVIARIFNCFGPRETLPYIIPEIIHQLAHAKVLRLGNIRAERDFTYVEDTARALIAVIESDIPAGEAVNVGSGVARNVEWIAMRTADLMGVADCRIEVDPERLRHMDIDSFVCDNTKLRRVTGWKPLVEFEQGLKATIEWYRKNGSRWSWENFVEGHTVYR